MSQVLDAICWNGLNPSVLMYVVSKNDVYQKTLYFQVDRNKETIAVKPFELEDSHGILGKYKIFLYEIKLEFLPENFEELLAKWLTNARCQSPLVWMMYDGIFGFDTLFAAELAASIYGISSFITTRPFVTLDDNEINSPEWREMIESHKKALNHEFE